MAAATFPELYAQFDKGGLDAIAQAEYFMLDGRIIPSYDLPRSRPVRAEGLRQAEALLRRR